MDAFFDRFARIPMLQKLLGMILICLLLLLAFYFLVYTPQQDEMAQVNNNIANQENALEEKKKMVGDLSQYKREVEKLNQDLQRALKLLPNRSEIPSLLQKISSLAKKSGLDILSFRPAPENQQGFYAKVPVELSLKGSFNEITSFFDAVGKLSRIVNISNFSMSGVPKGKGDEEQTKKVLSTKCTATTFRFIPSSNSSKKGK